jgi:hypothetical protein
MMDRCNARRAAHRSSSPSPLQPSTSWTSAYAAPAGGRPTSTARRTAEATCAAAHHNRASVAATTRSVSSGESLIHQMYQRGSFARWCGQLPDRRGDVNAGQHLLHVDTKHTSTAGLHRTISSTVRDRWGWRLTVGQRDPFPIPTGREKLKTTLSRGILQTIRRPPRR